MIVAVPREIVAGERRVALVPEAVGKLVKKGVEIVVESGAGEAAGFLDEAYREAGARIEENTEAVFSAGEVVLKVQPPTDHPTAGRHEVELLNQGATLIGFLFTSQNPDLTRRLRDHRVTAFAMELMPRITRAQSMDALSSMSNIAGYKAVLVAADALPKYFPMFMTAAGTITPARVLVLGAGVAGLQAIATAKRLGAVVEAFDIRPAVKEQVESLGGRFVELDMSTEGAEDAGGYAKEQSEDTQSQIRQLLHDHVKKSDVVITTALIPGKKAPVLVTSDMVRDMRPGSVIVDLAAEQGGNCEGTELGTVVKDGVTMIGPENLPSTLSFHASQLYARNVSTFLFHLLSDEGDVQLDLEDELTSAPLVTRDGEVCHDASREALGSSQGAVL